MDETKKEKLKERKMKTKRTVIMLLVVTIFSTTAMVRGDSLPSWNDGPTKSAIMDFVKDVTQKGSPDYVPPEESIAVFDNDGTLWV